MCRDPLRLSRDGIRLEESCRIFLFIFILTVGVTFFVHVDVDILVVVCLYTIIVVAVVTLVRGSVVSWLCCRFGSRVDD
jgi:hypothetical protein